MVVTEPSALTDPANVVLCSDTVSSATEAMTAAMAAARTGDEQYAADPTVAELEHRIAGTLGQQTSLFLPTGTMCNVIATLLHVRRGGDEVVAHRMSHILTSEAGGLARLSGAMAAPLDSAADVPDGTFSADQLTAAIRPANRYGPRTRMVALEQTVNQTGGRVWPLEQMRAVIQVARGHGLLVHLDGARLWNAAVSAGTDPAAYGALFDTVWVDFSKGLGCPGGACLAGPAELVEEAWRYKQMLGGASRQAVGMLAAAALHALDHHVDRLADDHARAARLADELTRLPGVEVVPPTRETNIVLLDMPDAPGLGRSLAADGVVVDVRGATRLRCVTHLDVGEAGLDRAIAAFRRGVASPTIA